ncbi:MAG: hypothetical protein K2Q25_04530 [Mycobacteriaceae bacterium]|nr:hypothetical protein [Mycobacteriaceae bacterium]
MDTVLGLSMTSTVAGWILAEGHCADGALLDYGVLGLQSGPGLGAMRTAQQLATEISHIQQTAIAERDRLRVVGVTWRDDAATEAALLVESLIDAGFDNVVPIQLHQAVAELAQATASSVGFQRTAVCVLEDQGTTIAMVDDDSDETTPSIKHVADGIDGLMRWLTGMFDRTIWRPDAVVVIGSEGDVDAVAGQLEEAFPVPVFVQTNVPLAVAQGAALAAARSTEFTDARLVKIAGNQRAKSSSSRSQRLSYASAWTGLVAGAVTLVASLSLAVGLKLVPTHDPGSAEKPMYPSTPQIAEAHMPLVPPSPVIEPPAITAIAKPSPQPVKTPPPAPASQVQLATPEPPPVVEPAAIPPTVTQIAQQEQTGPPVTPPESNSRPPLLTRLLEHLQGLDAH